MKTSITLVVAALLFATACGGGGGNSAPGPLSGNWQMSLQRSNSNLKPKTQSGFLVQQKENLAGNLILKASGCSGVGTVAGSISGSNVKFTVNPNGLQVNLTGTVGSDQASMSGDYTILAEGCSGPAVAPESGTWTASLIKAISGNFQGTFTSTHLGADIPASGQVTQSQNPSGNTSATLNGNLGVTGYCFDTATVVGSISGTDVVMNLLAADGTQMGQVSGTLSLDGTTLTGIYNILPQGPTGTPPCRSGDGGQVNLTLSK